MNQPSKKALQFLRWFCREDFLDEVEGDLLEIFELQSRENPKQANRSFWWQVLLHFRPSYFKKIPIPIFLSTLTIMFKHNLIISYRSMLRHKRTFLINIFGLTMGITCTMLILLWINDEMRFDRFHENDAQLYQVLQNFSNVNGITTLEWTPGPLASTLQSEFPEVELATSVFPAAEYTLNGILTSEENPFKASSRFINDNFFEVFSFKLLEGSSALEHQKILISDALAKKLFQNNSQAINKTIHWSLAGFEGDYLITGIFEKPPQNSTLQFDVLFAYDLLLSKMPDLQKWDYNNPATYLVLHEKTDVQAFDNKITDLTRKYLETAEGSLILRKYSNQYLYNQYENGVPAGGRINYIYLFSIIAVFITLIACINFINLFSSRASRRFKEIGVKKSFGIKRSTLVIQFLTESLFLSFLSAIVAALCAYLLLSEFNQITGKNIQLELSFATLFYFLALVVFNGIIAGAYPALYLSSLNSIHVFKKKLASKKAPLILRKGLVVFQFSISLVLIIASLVVYSQLTFIQTKNLGYNHQNIVNISADDKEESDLVSFMNELENVAGVSSVTAMRGNLFDGEHNTTHGLSWEGKDEDEKIIFTDLVVSYDFIKTMEIPLVAGRDFSKEFQNEQEKLVLNEAAVQAMQLNNPVGTTIRMWGKEVEIIGVVKDFHYESFYQEVKPCLFRMGNRLNNVLVKIKQGNEQNTLDYIHQLDKKYNYGIPFDFNFLEQSSEELYQAELKVAELSKYFTAIAILISCLGLLGLSTFTAEQKSKEMGVRKVLGAPISNIVYILSREFVLLIAIAICIGFPVAYFISESWLESFAYRINFSGWFLLAASLGLLLVSCLTISYQTLKVAFANPVKSLRSE